MRNNIVTFSSDEMEKHRVDLCIILLAIMIVTVIILIITLFEVYSLLVSGIIASILFVLNTIISSWVIVSNSKQYKPSTHNVLRDVIKCFGVGICWLVDIASITATLIVPMFLLVSLYYFCFFQYLFQLQQLSKATLMIMTLSSSVLVASYMRLVGYYTKERVIRRLYEKAPYRNDFTIRIPLGKIEKLSYKNHIIIVFAVTFLTVFLTVLLSYNSNATLKAIGNFITVILSRYFPQVIISVLISALILTIIYYLFHHSSMVKKLINSLMDFYVVKKLINYLYSLIAKILISILVIQTPLAVAYPVLLILLSKVTGEFSLARVTMILVTTAFYFFYINLLRAIKIIVVNK